MNKVKMFFVAAALVLTTAGVFAGKAKFAVTGILYGYNSGVGYVQLGSSTSATLNNLQTTGTQIIVNDAASQPYGLYSFTAPNTYTALSSTSLW